MRTAWVGHAATYVALAAGVLLLGAGIYAWWQVRAEPQVQAAVTEPADLSETEAMPSAGLASETVATAAEPARQAPVARKPNVVTRDLDCTDLRALFGLGENLTPAQKDYLQQHC